MKATGGCRLAEDLDNAGDEDVVFVCFLIYRLCFFYCLLVPNAFMYNVFGSY